MGLHNIRLELARTRAAPLGNPMCGYEFVAPLDDSGHFDEAGWRDYKAACWVRRFWQGENDERGKLVHTRDRKWVFSYAPGEEDDEPVFKFDRHIFRVGEYVSVTEHDGIQRPFKIVYISTLNPPRRR